MKWRSFVPCEAASFEGGGQDFRVRRPPSAFSGSGVLRRVRRIADTAYYGVVVGVAGGVVFFAWGVAASAAAATTSGWGRVAPR